MAINNLKKAKLTNEQKEAMLQMSPRSLPDHIGESGLSSGRIKAFFYNPLIYLFELMRTQIDNSIDNDTAFETFVNQLETNLGIEKNRINEILADYLKASDKAQLQSKIDLESHTRELNDMTIFNALDSRVSTNEQEITTKLNKSGGVANNLEISQRNPNLDSAKQPAVVKDVEDAINNLKANYSNDHIVGLRVDIDEETYKFKVIGTTESGTEVESNEIDLPLETTIVQIDKTEDETGLIFTLQNGNSITVSLGSIISNFVSKEDVADLNETLIQINQALQNEDTRQANETSRNNAESIRVSNETTRQENESTRQANENARQELYEDLTDFRDNDTEQVEELEVEEKSIEDLRLVQKDENGNLALESLSNIVNTDGNPIVVEALLGKLSRNKIHVIDSYYSYKCKTEQLEYTNRFITIPPRSLYSVNVSIRFSYSTPNQVELKTSQESWSGVHSNDTRLEGSNINPTAQLSGVNTSDDDLLIYIYGRWDTRDTNNGIVVNGFYIELGD